MPVDTTANFKRKRQFHPRACAKGSFRMKRIGKHGKMLVVCCPKGKFKRGRCKVGMRAQSILTPR